MKRKIPATLGIVLGTLAILVILAWPLAPLWARLGLEPFCIQGSWPHLQIVACSPRGRSPSAVTPRPLPTLSEQGQTPIIVDDDGSPDGMIALFYFLRNPLFDVKAVAISCGEAHPELFAPRLLRLLAGLGRADIPVGVGQTTPLAGDNTFPDPWRQASDDFWGLTYPEAPAMQAPTPAAELILETLNHAAQPVLVFVSGSHTNLAEALRRDPGVAGHIRDVQVMGGSIHVQGNIESVWPAIKNRVAEWNIWVDPLAAKEVFASGLALHLIPLDATNQVIWTEADALSWAASGSPEGMLDSGSSPDTYVWDLVAAVAATDPALCPTTALSIDVLTAPGPDQGRTVIADQPHNTTVCLDPDPEQMKALAAAILGR